jgi:hypothetical protein
MLNLVIPLFLARERRRQYPSTRKERKKSIDAPHPLQRAEALEGNARGTGDELKELEKDELVGGRRRKEGRRSYLCPLLVRERADCPPEVADGGVGWCEADKVGVSPPLVCGRDGSVGSQRKEEKEGKEEGRTDVDLGKARDEQLELALREDLENLLGDDLIKTLENSVRLILNLRREALLGDEANVLGLVLVGDGDVAAVGDEVDDFDDAELVALNGEGEVDDPLDGVGEHPLKTFVVLRIDRLEVAVVDGFAEHVLVDGSREVGFENALVVNRFADDASNEAEVKEVVVVDARGLWNGKIVSMRRIESNEGGKKDG